ncbi:MAG: MFS transporter [Thermoanaerobaculia bacterium]
MTDSQRPYLALRHRDFRLLSGATVVSVIGTQMQTVGIDWHIYVLTKSPLALGVVGLVRVIPIIAFSLLGGVVADRHDRRLVMFLAQSVMAVAALALAALTFFGRETLWAIYALTAVTSAATAFDNPARQALIPRLVPPKDLQGALSLNLTFFHVAMIGGPAVSGLVIAATGRSFGSATKGLSVIYLANAVSFVAVLAAIVVMKTSGKPVLVSPSRQRAIHDLRAGLHFVFRTPIMVSTMALDFFATFFSGAMSLLPILADQVLHVGPAGYGWLRAAPGIGALAASVVASVRPLPKKQGPLLLWAVAAYAVATIVYGLSRNAVLTFLALAATGLADLVSTVIRQTLRQILTPDELRGRMTSVNMIFFMGGPQLGEMEAGFVASLFRPTSVGAMISIAGGGVLTLLGVGIVAALAPVVRNYRHDSELPGSGSPQARDPGSEA